MVGSFTLTWWGNSFIDYACISLNQNPSSPSQNASTRRNPLIYQLKMLGKADQDTCRVCEQRTATNKQKY